jgi:hypothetical protein
LRHRHLLVSETWNPFPNFTLKTGQVPSYF